MGGKKTVCLSEEDPAIQRLIVMILEQDGIQATICPSGEELLGAISATSPDLALVDVGIPAEPTVGVIARIRAQFPTPVMAMSAGGDAAVAHACIQAGADDYLLKPFDPDTLLDRVGFLLGQPPAAERDTAVLSAGSIRLNFLDRSLTVGGRRVLISRTEWDILHTLARNAREPVFHGDLTRVAFDPELRNDAEYLRRWVERLQAKIGQDRGNRERLRPFHDVAYILDVSPIPAG